MKDFKKEDHLKLIRDLSADVVGRLGAARMQLSDRLPPAESTNFVTNVCVASLALSIELMVEELKGQIELDPKADDNIYEIKRKLGPVVSSIISDLAGPGYTVVRKTVETGDDEPSSRPT